MYCENCGASLDPQAKFCGQCGKAGVQQVAASRGARRSPTGSGRKRSASKLLIISLLFTPILVVAGLIIINRFSSKNEISEAREILRAAGEAAASIKDEVWSTIILREIGLAQARIRDQAGMRKTLERAMQTASWDEWARAMVATAQARGGDRPSAERVVRDLRTAMSMAGLPTGDVLWWGVPVIQAELGDVGGALETIRSFRNSSVESGALKVIADMQLEEGAIKKAMVLPPLAFCGGCGTPFPDLREDYGEIQVQAEAIERALQTVRYITDNGWKVVALINIAGVQANSGNNAGAKESLRQALQIALKYSRDSGTAAVLLKIAAVQGKIGDRINALRTIQETLGGGPGLNDYARSYLAVAYVQAGELQRARQIIGSIRTDYEKDFALAELAAAEADANNFDVALQTAALIKSDSWKVSAFKGIAVAYAKKGDFTRALETAAAMKGYDVGEALSLRGIAAVQASAGSGKAAREWATKKQSSLSKALALLGVAEGILERVEAKKAKSNKVTKKGV